MRNQTLLAALALAMFSACVGGIEMPGTGGGGGGDDGSGAPSSARTLFNSTVYPLLSTPQSATDAACSSCHVGPETSATNMYLGQSQDSDSFYNGITNDEAINGDYNPAAANLLLKGVHEGPAWTSANAMTIATWLNAEAAARGITPPTGGGTGSSGPANPDLTAIGAEEQWAACLSISTTIYQSTKAYSIANMESDNGRCYSCHEPGGAGGAYWGIDNNYLTMLSKWQQEVFITGPFQAQVQNTNPVTYQMAVAQEKICDKGMEQANNEGTHPSFDCTQTVGGVQPLTALQSFTTMVQAEIAAGSCPTPAFADPNAGSGSGSGSGSGQP
jgi:cytochrome c553